MPAYLSHAIMGEDLHKKSESDEKLFKVLVKKESLKANSIGQDLSIVSNTLNKYDAHNFNTKLFFMNLVKYIKDNKLYENECVMSLLYGQIAHYFLDVNTHPLIYYIEAGCKSFNTISSHMLVEGYLSSYIAEKILGQDYMNLKGSYLGHLDSNDKDVQDLIKWVYMKTYGDKQALFSYKSEFSVLKCVEDITKNPNLSSKEKLIEVSKFREFLEMNKLSLGEITNDFNTTWTNPQTNERHNESFMELYDKSITETQDAMFRVNGFIYDGNSIDTLNSVFTDLSFDTGVSCSLGKDLKYVRKI